MAVGDAGTILSSSDDGATWVDRTDPVSPVTSENLNGVSYGSGIFVAVGEEESILTSPDGAAWTPITTPGTSDRELFGVTYANSTFVAVGDGGTILTSNDETITTYESTNLALYNLDDDFPDTPQIVVNGLLSNSGQLSVQNSEFTLSGNVMLDDGILDLSGSTLILGGNLNKMGGTVTSTTATLKLNENISITSNDELNFQELELNRFNLSLGSVTSDLTISNAVTLNDPGMQIHAGTATLTLSGGMTMGQGTVSANGGKISLGNTLSLIHI